MRFVCVISAIVACLTPISATADSTASELSVVRLGADGRLVRVTLNSLQRAVVPAKRRAASMSTPPVITPLFTGGQTSIANRSVSDLVQDAARRYEVDPLLVHSVIHVESGFNPEAVSVKGAEGLMQLIPSTAQRFGVKNAFDPKQNIDAGVHYLKYLQDRFPNDLTLSLAAYNAGEGAVARYNSVPPYPETVNYVQKVKREYTVRQRAAQPSRTDHPQASAQSSATEEPVRHIQQYVDSEGRLYLRTR